MDNNSEIFLPETTVKLSVLKTKLSEVYGLELVTKKQKYLYISAIIILGGIVLYQATKKTKSINII
jgi:hypothetical protein